MADPAATFHRCCCSCSYCCCSHLIYAPGEGIKVYSVRTMGGHPVPGGHFRSTFNEGRQLLEPALNFPFNSIEDESPLLNRVALGFLISYTADA